MTAWHNTEAHSTQTEICQDAVGTQHTCLVVTINTSASGDAIAAFMASATPSYMRFGASQPSRSEAIHSSRVEPNSSTISPRSSSHSCIFRGSISCHELSISCTVVPSSRALTWMMFSNPAGAAAHVSVPLMSFVGTDHRLSATQKSFLLHARCAFCEFAPVSGSLVPTAPWRNLEQLC